MGDHSVACVKLGAGFTRKTPSYGAAKPHALSHPYLLLAKSHLVPTFIKSLGSWFLRNFGKLPQGPPPSQKVALLPFGRELQFSGAF